MLNSKLIFELSKLPDLPIACELKSDTEINVIAIDRHQSARILLADSVEAILDLYGLVNDPTQENDFRKDDYLKIIKIF